MAIFNATSDVIYESDSVFHVSPTVVADDQADKFGICKLVEVYNLPHDEKIVEPFKVGSCLAANNLFSLDSFVGVPAEPNSDNWWRSVARITRLFSSSIDQSKLACAKTAYSILLHVVSWAKK